MPSPQTIAQHIQYNPQGPITLEIYPTLRCNLDCLFCDTTDRHKPPQQELPLEKWIDIISEASSLGAKQIFILGGGEPTIHPHIIEIMQHAKDCGLRGMLTTNGTLLSKEKKKQIFQMQWDEIHFSVDGGTAITHDTLRGKTGIFQKVLRNISFFHIHKLRGNLPHPILVIHFVITNANYTEIPILLQLCSLIGVQRVDFDNLIAYRPEQQRLELHSTDGKKLQTIIAACLAHSYAVKHNLSQFIESPETRTRGTDAPIAGEGLGLAGAPCLKAWHHLVIQADGKTSPCCVLTGQGASIKNTTIETMWKSDHFLQEMRTAMLAKKPPHRCNECSDNILKHEREIRKHIVVAPPKR